MRPVPTGGGQRRPAAAVPTIKRIRFLPDGIEASLVNISVSGLLADSEAKLPVGSAVQVLFEGGFTPSSVGGRVARCQVASMDRAGLLRYHLAIEFETEIAFKDDEESATAGPTSAVSNRW